MKERNVGDTARSHFKHGDDSGSTNQRRGAWAETNQTKESGDSRSVTQRDIAAVAQLREAVNGSSPPPKWNDIGIIFGAVLMAASIFLTLVTVLGVNARANRLVENDATRARESASVVARLEGKLDDHIAAGKELQRTLDEHAATTTTATTVAARTPVGSPRTTATTRRPTTTTRPTPTTIRPTTTTNQVLAPATTLPPCRLALLNICLAR